MRGPIFLKFLTLCFEHRRREPFQRLHTILIFAGLAQQKLQYKVLINGLTFPVDCFLFFLLFETLLYAMDIFLRL